MKHLVDVHVGKRIRHRRWAVGTTQQQLAERVGIKFQQVQKYEKGTNRIGAGRLQVVAELLGVSVSAFFAEEGEVSAEDTDTLSLTKVEGAVSLMRAYASIDSEQVRKDVLALVRTAAKLSAAGKPQA